MNSIQLSISSITKNKEISNNNSNFNIFTGEEISVVTPLGRKGRFSPPKGENYPVSAPVVPSLVTSKNYENFKQTLDPNLTIKELSLSDDIHKNLAKKYENQNRARKILYKFERLIADTDPQFAHLTELERHYKASNAHTTIKCLRVKKKDVDTVGIRVDHKNQKAIYTGLQNCSSPWACPVCASKIQTRRALEIQKAFKWAYKDKQYQMAMVTLTFPHGISDDLGDTLEKVALAHTYFRKGKNYDQYKKFVNYQGMIKAMELTWGSLNGWHPHTHELQMIDFDISPAGENKIRKFILNKWEQACKKAGLLKHGDILNFRKRAVHVDFHVKDSDYLAKMNNSDRGWGADREVSSASTKKGRMTGLSPFQLLEESDSNEQYQNLFLEYALRMKGKKQLVWSRGLKEKIGLKDKSDEEIANEESSETDLLALLSSGQWRIVLKNDDRAYVQWLAVNCGFEGLAQYFKEHDSMLSRPDDTLGLRELEEMEKVKEKNIEKQKAKEEKVFAPLMAEDRPPKMTADEVIADYDNKYEKIG